MGADLSTPQLPGPAGSAGPATLAVGGKSARRGAKRSAKRGARRGARRSARRSARRGAKRGARRSAKRGAKRGMKGGSSCMKLGGGKRHSRGRGRN